MITSVDILGVPYRVESVDRIDDGTKSADILYHTATIRMADDSDTFMRRVILLHEIVHGMFEIEGHDAYRDDENLAKAISYGLVYILTHNPQLVRFLVEGDDQTVSQTGTSAA